ncbi:hypothetical protein Tco_0309528 [Tanacetum coccineum]
MSLFFFTLLNSLKFNNLAASLEYRMDIRHAPIGNDDLVKDLLTLATRQKRKGSLCHYVVQATISTFEQEKLEENAITTNSIDSALADSDASINIFYLHSIFKQLGLEAVNDASHNLASKVISDHEPEQNESSITFSPRSDPLHHEFAEEVITLPSWICIENVHANQSSIIESLPVSPIPVEDSEPVQEEIDIFLVPDDFSPGVEYDNSKDEDNGYLN